MLPVAAWHPEQLLFILTMVLWLTVAWLLLKAPWQVEQSLGVALEAPTFPKAEPTRVPVAP